MSGLHRVPALFFTALCHVIVVYHMSERKYSLPKFILYGCMFVAGFVGMGAIAFSVGGITAVLMYIGIVVCLFLFSCLVSRDFFSKKCFLFITYFCFFSVLDNILKLAIKLALPKISAMAGYNMAIVLRSAIILLALALYKKYAVVIFRSIGDSSRGWWNLALIAMLFYVLQALLSILNERNDLPSEHLLLALVAISFVMCAVYGIVFSNISYMKKDAEAALVRQNAEYLSNRLSVLQNAEKTHRMLRHDMHHHLEMIAEYAKIGDTSAVLGYIKEYCMEVSETSVEQYSLNRTVNSILSAYADKAEKSGIGFSIRCKVPIQLNVRDIDLIALLGNLLENALHGCRESGKEKQCIEIHIQMRNNMLLIACRNTCSDHLKLSGGLPVGTSIGISSILAVCQRYDGNLDYKIENQVCSACAVLNF